MCIRDRTSIGPSPTLSLSPWQVLPDTPQKYSTALSVHGALFAVGGTNDWSAIYHYQPSNGSWIKAGELPTGRTVCACTILPSGELLVVGGSFNASRVDIANFLL